MSDPPHHHNLSNQCVQDTIGHPSKVERSSSSIGPNHSEGMDSINGHGAATVDVNLTLSLNSASHSVSQYQAIPMLGQLGLPRHVGESRIRRSNLTEPLGIRSLNMSHYPLGPRNGININIFMRRNSPLNSNHLNENPPSHITINNFSSSSFSVNPVRNNVISAAASNFKQPLLSLPSNQEPTLNNDSEAIKSSQLTKTHIQQASPSATTLTGKTLTLTTSVQNDNQDIPTAIPCMRQEMALSFPHQGQAWHPSQSSDLQHQAITPSKSNLGSLSLLSRHFHNERHSHPPGFTSPLPGFTSPPPGFTSPLPGFTSPPPGFTSPLPGFTSPPPGFTSPPPGFTSPLPVFTSPPPGFTSPIIKAERDTESNFVVDNRASYGNGLHPQPSHLARYESHSVTEHVSDRVSDHITRGTCLLPSHLQEHSKAQPNNAIMTGPQRYLAQAIGINGSVHPDPHLRRQRVHKSQPYIKNGPYTCPLCHVIYENGHCFSAHFRNHYKDETPAEQKERREGKIRKRALHIAQSIDGLTVIPGSPQPDARLLVPSNMSDENVASTSRGGSEASMKIKEEVLND